MKRTWRAKGPHISPIKTKAAIALGVSRAPQEPVPAAPGLVAEATTTRIGLRLITVPLQTPDDASRLIALGFDVQEHIEDGAAQVLGDDATAQALAAAGFRYTQDDDACAGPIYLPRANVCLPAS